MNIAGVHRRLALAGATVALALAAAACSGSSSGTGAAGSPTSSGDDITPSTAATASPAVGFAADGAAIRDAMATLVEDDVAPGVVVLIRHHDKLRLFAYGDASTTPQEEMTTSHVFRIGSITKSIMSATVLRLAERGVLSLDDTVEQWLPGQVPHGDNITIEQLLDHSSGLANYTDTPLFESVSTLPKEPMSPRKLVHLGTSQGMLFPPGTSAHYSNTGYVLLGMIIERVTRRSLADNLQRFVFTPAHMTASHQGSPVANASVAHGYDEGADVTGVPLAWAWGAGDVVADARDVATFFRRLLDGRLLQRDSLARMQNARQTMPDYSHYGLGLARTDTVCGSAWGHEGQFVGFTSAAWTDQQQDRQVVILTNATVDTPALAFQTVINTGLCGATA